MILGYTLESLASKIRRGRTIRGYTLPEKEAIKEITGYKGVNVAEDDFGNSSTSFLGLTIEETSYTLNGKKFKTPKIYLPVCIVTVGFNKVIEETIMQSQRHRGTVKQIINFGDYNVTIDFILCNDDSKYPFNLLKQATNIEQSPVSLSVTSKILEAKGISNLVIKSGGFRQSEFHNLQAYQWQCMSDEPFELQIKRQNSLIR
jgi:hypothetical protein